ncbi:Gfo/Idh/MocA family protein [Arcticibacter eurypsychrophilus]|uniref:Gfo/Idh/MocA family protein n=1 Tax=Arcticibacter eurypsychrophilus TaxID=1434752 RepID=UPI00084CF1DF|nr:Gfo/Idh/MocA family oxidoreductase [Arcticibacter eurypsychrophilus]
MNTINWGIIGCGDVTERKSGPAFNKVPNSKLVAVMRRDAAKAEDYARRHGVPKWYTDASELINDPEVNAIYIATPPDSHEKYSLEAMKAGKPVYVEKPMTLSRDSAERMFKASEEQQVKLTVAHYRRGLPIFNKIKELIDSKAIGDIRYANLHMLQQYESPLITQTDDNWRVNPEISGGGLFHDLAPHQLDLMLFFFGPIKFARGISANQAGYYKADDIVAGELLFENGIFFSGLWCFSVPPEEQLDRCVIMGSEGKITFSVFGNYYILSKNGKDERIEFNLPENIQHPMIQLVVDYFLDKGPNPCDGSIGIDVMNMLDQFTLR